VAWNNWEDAGISSPKNKKMNYQHSADYCVLVLWTDIKDLRKSAKEENNGGKSEMLTSFPFRNQLGARQK
jgi:hypothetical protein